MVTRKARVYKKYPKGWVGVDPCRNLKQAREMQRCYPKEYKPIIVQVGIARGKEKIVFPYEIGVNKKRYR